jgi:hypothetical protein
VCGWWWWRWWLLVKVYQWRTESPPCSPLIPSPALPHQQTYYVSRQHRRAVMLLKQHGVLEDARFR